MPAPLITLRHATPADLALLRHWDEQEHVIDSDPNDDWNWETELQKTPDWREFLIAEADERSIGFVQIIDPELEETHYWGNVPSGLRALDIWIGEKDDLGKGYGTVMMRLAIERCFKSPEVTAILIDPLISNTDAHRFYERMGFVFLREERFGEDECKVYELSRTKWNKQQPML